MSIKNSSKVGKRVRFILDNGGWACGICIDVEKTKGRDHSHVDFGGIFPAWVATRDLAVIGKHNANREYKAQGVMIDGTRTDISYHRTESGARRAQRRLKNAYASRRLQIVVEVRRLNDEGKYAILDSDD